MKTRTMVVVLLACAAFAAFGTDPVGKVRIGFIDPDPAAIAAKHGAAANYLGARLGSFGITGGEIVVASSLDQMAGYLKAGKVDVFIDTVFPSLLMEKRVNSKMILRRWKKGVGVYQGVFVVKKESPITSLTALNGKRVGFEDPTSSSARWLPQAMLIEAGYAVQPLKNAEEKPGASTVGYVFTGSVEDTQKMLLSGAVDIGVISTNDYDEMPQDVRGGLRIVGKSIPIPRQLVSVRGDLSPGLVKAISTAFVDMNKNPEGVSLLKAWEKTFRLDPLDAAITGSIATSRKLLLLVESEM